MKIIYSTILAFLSFQSVAQYNACAAKSEIEETREIQVKDESTGSITTQTFTAPISIDKKDTHGNAKGNQYDLAVDGAFEGQTIFVLQQYEFEFSQVEIALKEKGFGVYRMRGNATPDLKSFEEALSKSCQFWLISGASDLLSEEHLALIEKYFYSGKGVYIWGDNTPFHADANRLAKQLVKASMIGNYIGSQNVTFKSDSTSSGMLRNHLITTGLETVYEGITISKINDNNQLLQPLIWSTDGNVVTSIYDQQGARLIIDGGFTRLYNGWDNAGTGRYIKNAAAWLVNYERFGEDVLGEALKTDKDKETK